MTDKIISTVGSKQNIYEVANILSELSKTHERHPRNANKHTRVSPYEVKGTIGEKQNISTGKSLLSNEHSTSVLSSINSSRTNSWTVNEQIQFVALGLLKLYFPHVMKQHSYLISTRSLAQLNQHYYRHRRHLGVFAKYFLSYYGITTKKSFLQRLQLKGCLITKDEKEIKFENAAVILKQDITNKEFITHFNTFAHDEECNQFFSKIFSHIVFEPRFLISETQNDVPGLNNRKENLRSSRFKLHSDRSSNVKDRLASGKITRKVKFNEKVKETNEERATNPNNEIKFIKIQFEESLFDAICKFQDRKDNIVIDINFLQRYLIEGFELSSAEKEREKEESSLLQKENSPVEGEVNQDVEMAFSEILPEVNKDMQN